jgi:carbonic anhydrase
MFSQAQAYYSRILTWIAIDSMLPLERQYYDVAGSLWKKEVFEDVSVINGIATPLHVTMEDVQTRTMTELKVQQVEYDRSIPDSLFDPVQLPQGVQFSTWQAYMSQVAEGK